MYDSAMTELQAWRERVGLTQREAAALASELRGARVYPHQISNWENGAGTSPSTRAFLQQLMRAPIKRRKPRRHAS